MTISEMDLEQLSQLLDGELDTVARQQLEIRISLEPALAATWHDLQAMNAQLRQAFPENAACGVPRNIAVMLEPAIRSSSTLRHPASRSARKVLPFLRRQSPWPTALAASVVLAVAVALFPDSSTSPASAPGLTLAAALESLPSGDSWQRLDDGSQVQAVLTFPRIEGGWCREFALQHTSDAETRRGVACRTEGQWRTEVIAQTAGPESRDVYRPAGAGDNETVHHFVRNQAADIPLNGAQEATLIAQGWR